MKLKVLFQLLKESFNEWNEDRAPRLGAALAYYTLFSLAPLLIIVVAVAGWVYGPDAARGKVADELQGMVGPMVAQAIQDMIKHTAESGSGVLATLIGVVMLLVGASGVFVELQDALNTIWKVKPKQGRALLNIIKDRFLSFAMVLVIGLLLLVSLLITASLAAVDKWLIPVALPGGTYLWQAINVVVSFLFATLLFALLYKTLPDVKIAWSDVWMGAAVTALLFTIGKYLIALYLGRSSVASAYGAAGSLVIVLVWVYYSSQLVLFGAEFTRVHARKRGTPVDPADNATHLGAEDQAPCAAPSAEPSRR